MSKAILVIDMPKNSEKCPFFEEGKGYDRYDYCPIHIPTTVIGYSDKRCYECPLKEIPHRQIEERYDISSEYDQYYINEWAIGWNDCLKEIGGE